MSTLQKLSIEKLEERGIRLEDIASLVINLQKKYNPDLTVEYCVETIREMLKKREIAYALLTGAALDKAAEQGILDPEINKVIRSDESLYGIDEILALSITNTYGSIALTNFGYLDKSKPDIIGKLDEEGKNSNRCHTFMDDIIAAIAAAAASKLAHEKKELDA